MENINVWFQNSENKERVVGRVVEPKDIMNVIKDFLDDHNYKSYYTRIWYHEQDNRTWFDVGSHTEFFFVEGNIYNEMVKHDEEEKKQEEQKEKDKQSRYTTYYRPE